MEAGLGPAPQHVLRIHRPLVLDQIVDLARAEFRPEGLAEVCRRSGISQQVVSERAVASRERVQQRPRQPWVALRQVLLEGDSIAARYGRPGQRGIRSPARSHSQPAKPWAELLERVLG